MQSKYGIAILESGSVCTNSWINYTQQHNYFAHWLPVTGIGKILERHIYYNTMFFQVCGT
jgi:hypothetical protein